MSLVESGENMMDNTKTSNGSMVIYEIKRTSYDDMIYAIPVSKRKFQIRVDVFIEDYFSPVKV